MTGARQLEWNVGYSNFDYSCGSVLLDYRNWDNRLFEWLVLEWLAF